MTKREATQHAYRIAAALLKSYEEQDSDESPEDRERMDEALQKLGDSLYWRVRPKGE